METLLANGASQREIERRIGVDRKTIRRYAAGANSPGVATGSGVDAGPTPPARPPALVSVAVSACAPHRPFIEAQVRLGRNAQSIYQDLVERHGFAHRYNSVKRFVRVLKAREPERFDVLEFLPGEEAQVDYGQGALTRQAGGKYRRPYLFVMTLKYSGKSFRKVVWKTNQETWARLHEEGFRALGGVTEYVVLDNLREGVIHPDLYEPELNPVYAAMLAHYGAIADACRVGDPNRKGTVESAIQHTQSTALKGRKFESIEAQNAWLAHWEERWAAPRIHGRKKRQVLAMYREEKPHLRPLPIEGFRYFRQESRTVDDAGCVQIDARYYPALPARLYSQVTVRVYAQEIEILRADGTVLRRHPVSAQPGYAALTPADRLFNPSRETVRLLSRVAKIGPFTARFGATLFATLGRPGQKALYGLANLPRTYRREDIEAVCQAALAADCRSYRTIKRALERRGPAAPPSLTQVAPEIRAISDYQGFFDAHAKSVEENHDAHVNDGNAKSAAGAAALGHERDPGGPSAAGREP
jgi:transposase